MECHQVWTQAVWLRSYNLALCRHHRLYRITEDLHNTNLRSHPGRHLTSSFHQAFHQAFLPLVCRPECYLAFHKDCRLGFRRRRLVDLHRRGYKWQGNLGVRMVDLLVDSRMEDKGGKGNERHYQIKTMRCRLR